MMVARMRVTIEISGFEAVALLKHIWPIPAGIRLQGETDIVSDLQRNGVNLSNWRLAPYNQTSLTRVRELIPSANIAARGRPMHLPRAIRDLSRLSFAAPGGGEATIAQLLARSTTDGWVVRHRGSVVHEWYRTREASREPHIVYSVSKSITATLAGILWGDGKLDPDAPVTRYVPEVANSAYGDATVRNVLDMTVSLAFGEDYLNPDDNYLRYRESTGWNPRRAGFTANLNDYLAGLQKNTYPHGARFHYCSPNSDLLGWIVERASGQRLAEFMSERLWSPLGAASDGYITVDAAGAPRTAGGICVTVADLARFGEMVRCRGVANGQQVVPGEWIDDIRAGGKPEQWARGEMLAFLPQGRYRSKWYTRGGASHGFFANGIHSQWLYIDPAADLVVAKVSAQALPVDEALDQLHLAAFDALAERLNR
jgi:CubicO group peptidase (beta-lactamase class C family)